MLYDQKIADSLAVSAEKEGFCVALYITGHECVYEVYRQNASRVIGAEISVEEYGYHREEHDFKIQPKTQLPGMHLKTHIPINSPEGAITSAIHYIEFVEERVQKWLAQGRETLGEDLMISCARQFK